MEHNHDPAKMLARAVALATSNVASGGGPFAALVVTADGKVFEGANRVTADFDPTAHAEVSAIRNACSSTATFDLSGALLYSSCEPCPMCLAAALWARVERVYFAADRHDAAAAGFDDAAFYSYFADPEASRLLTVAQVSLPISNEPFDLWQSTEVKTEY